MTLNKPKKISTGTPFEFGEHRFHFGEEIVELADSTPLLNNLGALHRKMRRDGYLFIRGFHPQEHAEKATHWTLQAIAQSGGLSRILRLKRVSSAKRIRHLASFGKLRWLMLNRFLMLWIARERCSSTKNSSVAQSSRSTNVRDTNSLAKRRTTASFSGKTAVGLVIFTTKVRVTDR